MLKLQEPIFDTSTSGKSRVRLEKFRVMEQIEWTTFVFCKINGISKEEVASTTLEIEGAREGGYIWGVAYHVAHSIRAPDRRRWREAVRWLPGRERRWR